MNTFWIAEKFKNGRSAGYFAGGDTFKDFVADIEQALQFCRKQDAERVISFMFGDMRATEHCYIEGTLMCKCPYAEDQSQEWHPINSTGCKPGAGNKRG